MKHSLPIASQRTSWLFGWLLWLVLGASGWQAAYGQSGAPFTVRVTPAGPLSLAPGGSQVLMAQATYPAFEVGTGFNNAVYALAYQADGKILVGGSFTSYNGTARSYLVRLNPDGSLDSGFVLAGAGLDGAVKTIALQADGKVLVGGEFQHDGTTTRNYLARLTANGSLDNTFAPQAGPNGPVAAIVVQPDGKAVIGGSFGNYNGVARSALARVLPTGALDTTFETTYASSSSAVTALALQADGKVLVGGSLSSYSSTGTTTQRNYIARFYPSGALDAAFAPPQVSTALHPITTYVQAIAVQPDGKVLIGGYLSYISGQNISFVRRLDLVGNTEFNYTQSTYPSQVTALAVQADGKILVGETAYTYIPPKAEYHYLIRLTASGELDALIGRSAISEFTPVYALLPLPSGQTLLGGNFTSFNGSPINRLARINLDGTLGNAAAPVVGASYTWSTGATGASLTVTAAGLYTATATYGGASATSPAVVVSGGTYRLNAGAGALLTNRGLFAADQYYSAGSSTYSTSASIAGTLDPALFQTERYSTTGTLSYALPVANGTYKVVLYFAEIYWTQVGQRVFNVSLEGVNKLTNYDILKKVGPRVATSESFTVTVTDGVLNLDLRVPYESGGADQAKLSALEVLPASPPSSPLNQLPVANAGATQTISLPPAGTSTPTNVGSATLQGSGTDADGTITGYTWSQLSGPTTASFSSQAEAVPIVSNLARGEYVFGLTVRDNYGASSLVSQVRVTVIPSPYVALFRLNVGGAAGLTTRGNFYADKYPDLNSARFATTAAIKGTQDPILYQTERYSTNGELHYAFDYGNGNYVVVLHFAEIYWTQPGQRVFDVSLEGNKVLTKYDIVKKVGPLTATIETFSVTVTDGVLNLDLRVPYEEGGIDQAKLSALEIWQLVPVATTSQLLSTAASRSALREVSIYPNPSAGRATLACLASLAQAATLTLTDQLGRLVRQQLVQLQAGTNQLAVDANGLAPGLYQLSIATADGQRQSQKLAIQP